MKTEALPGKSVWFASVVHKCVCVCYVHVCMCPSVHACCALPCLDPLKVNLISCLEITAQEGFNAIMNSG